MDSDSQHVQPRRRSRTKLLLLLVVFGIAAGMSAWVYAQSETMTVHTVY
jgi:hypothetical protein